MNLDNRAYLFLATNNYNIYQIYNQNAMAYYLCIPNNTLPEYNIFLGIPSIDLESSSKEEIINEITKAGNTIMNNCSNPLYILPTLSITDLKEATDDNDDRLYRSYNDLYEPIKSAINDAYHLILAANGKVVKVITAVKQNEIDTKFINWLETSMGKFYKSILLSDIANENTYTDDDGTPESYGSKTDGLTNVKSNTAVKKLVPVKSNRHGFSNFTFILLVLLISIVIGIGSAYMLIK